MLASQGTLAAIGQAFGGKNSKAMRAFAQALGGDAATAGDSRAMGSLRSRLRQIVSSGQRAS
jgi:hypothetical protein